MDSHTFIILIP